MIDVPALPDGYVCDEGTVPGWLNADGLPTACVGDLPLVEPLPERTVDPNAPELIPPIDVYPSSPVTPPASLPETGADVWSWLLVGVLLVAVGGWMLWGRRAFGGVS